MQALHLSLKPGSPQKTLSNYLTTKYKHDESSFINNKPRGGILTAVYKDIPTENTSQLATSKIKILKIKIKTIPKLTVGAASSAHLSQHKFFRSGRHRTVTLHRQR